MAPYTYSSWVKKIRISKLQQQQQQQQKLNELLHQPWILQKFIWMLQLRQLCDDDDDDDGWRNDDDNE
jgi:hypothetical protein